MRIKILNWKGITMTNEEKAAWDNAITKGDETYNEEEYSFCDELNITFFPRTSICRKFLTLTGDDVPAWHKGKDYFEYSSELS